MKYIIMGSMLLFGLSAVGILHGGDRDKVAFPEDYRGWYHVKSMVIKPGHPLENPFQGIHHIYANDQAHKGLKTGNYRDGAVLVFDLLDYDDADHALQEGARKLIGVMERDSKRFAATGGWGFEGFDGDDHDKRLTTDGGKSCFQCHTAVEDTGYVFSRLRD
jgi:hypothetical protein